MKIKTRLGASLSALLCLLTAQSFAQTVENGPIQIKSGDVLTVVTTAPGSPYSGEYTVQADGAIYGLGFNRLTVAGKSVDDAQKCLRTSLHTYIREKFVYLTLKSHRQDVVFVLGPNSPGPIPYTTPISVRQVLAGIPHPASQTLSDANSPTLSNPETMKVELIRNGKRLFLTDYGAILRGSDPNASKIVVPDDVLAFVPEEVVRVWVTGNVRRPGEMLLPEGATVYQAIASAGGLGPDSAQGSVLESQVKVYLRHGPDERQLSAQPDGKDEATKLESGDVVSVRVPLVGHATVMGEVGHAGRVEVRDGDDILSAIGQAGGVNANGTLRKVMLVRDGSSRMLDLSGAVDGTMARSETIQTGDLVFVQRNNNAVSIFGHVVKPGRYLMEDRKPYTLADVLSLAGGLGAGGSLRKVYIGRKGPDGKLVIKRYNLDEYLKDGKAQSNPTIEPGDAIMFDSTKGLSFGTIAQVLASGVVVGSAVGGL